MRLKTIIDGEEIISITTDFIPRWWGIAEENNANRHLADYGVIFLDEEGLPIENEYVTDCIFEESYKPALKNN